MNHLFIIPTYGRADLVRQAIESLYQNEIMPSDFSLCVVDDGATYSAQEELKKVCKDLRAEFIAKSANTGFAATVNTALNHYAQARLDFITLVNNDIIFTHPVIDVIEKNFKDNPKLGILGAKLLYLDGRIQHAGMSYATARKQFVHDHYGFARDIPSANMPKFCMAVTGALFTIRGKCLDALGPLNEKYFIACEDTEYCLRAWQKGFQVFYDPAYTAIHLEGATRGASPSQKKRQGKVWMKKEIDAIRTFQKDLRSFNISRIQRDVSILNRKEDPVRSKKTIGVKRSPKVLDKLEVGSGHNPQPGYTHMDVRKDLPDLDFVCDFSKDKLPFKDNTFSEVLANHVIEHISWRKLPHVIREWHRVLKPKGRLVLRTPDLKFICEKYLAGQTTPEHPDDEGFIKRHLCFDVTPSWWANIKLFSGQDYDANFHHVCFDFPMLSALLSRFGFAFMARINLGKEFSPGELQVEAFKK